MNIQLARVLFYALFLTASFAAGAETTVLRAARILDVDSGKMITPGVVVIDDNHISAINPAGMPAGATVVELPGITLLPGLMDMHTHLTSDMSEGWLYREVETTPVDDVLLGVKYAKITLLAGFTTVRDVGSRGFTDVSLMRAIDAGTVDGPRIIPAGYAIGITGGHCDVTGYAPGIAERGPEQGVADGKDEILKAVRYMVKHGVKVIKTCATAGVLSLEGSPGAQQYSDEELRVLVEEAHRHELKVAAHAHGTQGIIAASNAGVDSIEHGSILNKEAIATLKKNGTWLVPTLFQWFLHYDLPPLMDQKNEYVKSFVSKSMRDAFKAGVKVAFGTDAGAGPHGRNAEEFAAYVDHGMSPIDAIRTATINAAEMMDIKDRGRIQPGLLADIVGVSGSPLDNIRIMEDVKFVMKDGKVYKQP